MHRIILSFLFLISLTTEAAESINAETTLRELATQFLKARALPLGSRPHPPATNINKLVGLSPSIIQNALGAPDLREENYPPLDCKASQCWSFTYGPEPAPIPDSVENDGGMSTIYVRTGGPWLLICGFDNEKLVTVFWRGQK